MHTRMVHEVRIMALILSGCVHVSMSDELLLFPAKPMGLTVRYLQPDMHALRDDNVQSGASSGASRICMKNIASSGVDPGPYTCAACRTRLDIRT
jgi:hypothetical protein